MIGGSAGDAGTRSKMAIRPSEAYEPGESGASREPRGGLSRPLVVDVDHVLQHGDPTIEIAISEILSRPRAVLTLCAALLRGPAALRQRITQASGFDAGRLSYRRDTVNFLLRVLGDGRPVYLASDRYGSAVVEAIAQHLGVFAAWSATASGERQQAELPNPSIGAAGFDFLGPAGTTLPDGASRIAGPVAATRDEAPRSRLKTWAKLLRVHQYSKNALILVPLLTAHRFAVAPIVTAILAATAFSLCASSAYILNDLVDVAADRAHPTKRNRPIASGDVAPAHAMTAMAMLLTGAVTIAAGLSLPFLGILLAYFAMTTAYSLRLKRIALVDVTTLAILYTARVVAGAVAIGVTMSEWLFAFSLFIFMSLALVKRYVELNAQRSTERLTARDYSATDLPMVAVLAAASGFNAVVVFTLYISSETVHALYARPQILWAGCPVLMYWIARVMLMAQRGLIEDDPVVFALRDRVSWLALAAFGAIMLVAI
jgi:4-hydroxybenzoate polyprenyltransferase